jgi:hypothetical protein
LINVSTSVMVVVDSVVAGRPVNKVIVLVTVEVTKIVEGAGPDVMTGAVLLVQINMSM